MSAAHVAMRDHSGGDPVAGPVVVREYVPGEPIAPITALLHAAYAVLGRAGMRYLASHQGDDVTRRRLGSSSVAFIAEADGRPVGTISLRSPEKNSIVEWYRRPDVFVLAQLGVHPDFQRRGIGFRLYCAAIAAARQRGAAHVALDTSEDATRLINGYKHYGFEIVERFSWPGTNYRSVVMSMPLAASLQTQSHAMAAVPPEAEA
jgi:ribosomal protein S18 acetylase RimI-like enzyme